LYVYSTVYKLRLYELHIAVPSEVIFELMWSQSLT